MSSPLPDVSGLTPFQLRRVASQYLGVEIKCRYGEKITKLAPHGASVVIVYSRTVTTRRRRTEHVSHSWRVQVWMPNDQGTWQLRSDQTGEAVTSQCLDATAPSIQEVRDHARHVALGRPYRQGYRTPVSAR